MYSGVGKVLSPRKRQGEVPVFCEAKSKQTDGHPGTQGNVSALGTAPRTVKQQGLFGGPRRSKRRVTQGLIGMSSKRVTVPESQRGKVVPKGCRDTSRDSQAKRALLGSNYMCNREGFIPLKVKVKC